MDLEYIWSATDPLEKKKAHVLPLLRSWISNLFHEQNHRILWRFLPKPPQKGDALRKYLNFTESLVIALDMALSDQIGTQLASLFHLCGVVYDPGAQHPRNGLKHRTQTRQVRTYLHACTYATYLVLEHYEPKQIVQATQALFPEAGSLATLAAERSLRLDSEFVRVTNPFWQRQHGKAVSQAFQNKPGETLELPDDPMNSYLNYLWAERWFQKMGL
jgi:hypothetical protein